MPWAYITYPTQRLRLSYQELMSHPKGGEGAFNYVVTALSKVQCTCCAVTMYGKHFYGMGGPTYDITRR